MNETPLPDPLDKFLQSPPSLASDAALEEELLDDTMQMLPPKERAWPAWPIVAGLLTGSAACIALALLVGWWLARTVRVADAPAAAEMVEQMPQRPMKEPVPHPVVPKPEVKPTPPRAIDLEWSAFDADDDAKRTRLYFRAGDLYLTVHNDLESATRCYHQALVYAGPHEVAMDPNDNWLVMALKRDFHKEK